MEVKTESGMVILPEEYIEAVKNLMVQTINLHRSNGDDPSVWVYGYCEKIDLESANSLTITYGGEDDHESMLENEPLFFVKVEVSPTKDVGTSDDKSSSK